MNKKEYKKLFKPLFENFPVDNDKVFDEIDRAESALLELRNEYRSRLYKKYYFCSKCNKYYLRNAWKEEINKEINYGVVVYSDCGYGDNDEIADVEYNVKYKVCPKCGNKAVIGKETIREFNRRDRR